MKTTLFLHHYSIFLVAILLAQLSTSCGKDKTPSVDDAATSCGTGAAQIQVYDGFMQRLCGCTEASAMISPPATLTCTVAKGTKIFFHFTNIRTSHQIVSTASPELFAPSAIAVAGKSNPAYVLELGTTGTYGFKDRYLPEILGQIVIP